jgi:two-component system response regulator AtoC
LRGETGTGKELFARAFAAAGPRSDGPYVPVAIPALSPSLVESELFGHVKGAFTEAARDKKGRLEVADGGVLFLDEVGDIAPELQVKLLRFLDTGELVRVGDTAERRIDVHVVSASNRPIERDLAAGRFRPDLLARLGHTVKLPPLRERREDVPLLAEHYLAAYGGLARGMRFSEEAIAALQAHGWPFNVRELQQVVERSVCLCDHEVVGIEDLPDYLREARPALRAATASPPLPLADVVSRVEREHILRTLEFTKGSRRKAIELLGISPDTFYRRLRALGIGAAEEPTESRPGPRPEEDAGS